MCYSQLDAKRRKLKEDLVVKEQTANAAKREEQQMKVVSNSTKQERNRGRKH
jgi:hypothetical protein